MRAQTVNILGETINHGCVHASHRIDFATNLYIKIESFDENQGQLTQVKSVNVPASEHKEDGVNDAIVPLLACKCFISF